MNIGDYLIERRNDGAWMVSWHDKHTGTREYLVARDLEEWLTAYVEYDGIPAMTKSIIERPWMSIVEAMNNTKITHINENYFTISDDKGCTMHIQGNQFHRENGPAVDSPLVKEWYRKGKLHRDNGPARIFFDSRTVEFWIDGMFETAEIVSPKDQWKLDQWLRT